MLHSARRHVEHREGHCQRWPAGADPAADQSSVGKSGDASVHDFIGWLFAFELLAVSTVTAAHGVFHAARHVSPGRCSRRGGSPSSARVSLLRALSVGSS